MEEQNAGYQAAYSRLAASEGGATVDPVGDVTDARVWVRTEFSRGAAEDAEVKGLVARCEADGMGGGLGLGA